MSDKTPVAVPVPEPVPAATKLIRETRTVQKPFSDETEDRVIAVPVDYPLSESQAEVHGNTNPHGWQPATP